MKQIAALAALFAALGVGAVARAAEPSPARDWSALLRADATAMKAALEDSHPGPVDPENPAFREALDEGFERALERARTADSQGGWWWALREYEARFNDGHLTVSTTRDAPALPTRWPGFLTRIDGDRQIVATSSGEAGLPAIGAELVSCDGVAAATLAEENVGRFRGRWFLASQRSRHGMRLFLDAGNPWVRQPKNCLFRNGADATPYDLDWRVIDGEEAGRRLTEASFAFQTGFERRRVGDGWWLEAGSFDGDPSGEAHGKLRALIGGLRADRTAIRAAPFIVLDVRGNGGGSSTWGVELAVAIWGENYLTQFPSTTTAVDWRASAANRAVIAAYLEQVTAAGDPNPQLLKWLERALAGMDGAIARSEPLWREINDDGEERPAGLAGPQYRGRVYILTDAACASACLDTVDLWKRLGAIQIGAETSADTLYMELRDEVLPSGLARLNLPMKVYRGRERGNNETQRPDHVYPGPLNDTAAVEAWVLELAGKPAR